jgi:hypothetical protein
VINDFAFASYLALAPASVTIRVWI